MAERRPTAPPAIYFLSDYGTADEFVGVVHAVLHRLAPVGPGHRPLPPDPAFRRGRPAPPCWCGAPPTSGPAWCWPWSIPGWAPPGGPWPCGRRPHGTGSPVEPLHRSPGRPDLAGRPGQRAAGAAGRRLGGIDVAVALGPADPGRARPDGRRPTARAHLRRPGRLRPGRRPPGPGGRPGRLGPVVDPATLVASRRPASPSGTGSSPSRPGRAWSPRSTRIDRFGNVQLGSVPASWTRSALAPAAWPGDRARRRAPAAAGPTG